MIACNDPEHEAQRAETRPLYCWDCGGRMRPSRSLATVARYACEGCGLDSPATILIRKQARASEPCLVCGAPILDGIGHDDGCMVAPAPIADYIAEIRRDIEAAESADDPIARTVPNSPERIAAGKAAFSRSRANNPGRW